MSLDVAWAAPDWMSPNDPTQPQTFALSELLNYTDADTCQGRQPLSRIGSTIAARYSSAIDFAPHRCASMKPRQSGNGAGGALPADSATATLNTKPSQEAADAQSTAAAGGGHDQAGAAAAGAGGSDTDGGRGTSMSGGEEDPMARMPFKKPTNAWQVRPWE